MQLRDARQAIPEIDQLFAEIFLGLKAVPGTIARLSVGYLRNYGIDVTEDNTPFIEELARKCNAEDWQGSRSDIHTAIQTAIARAGLEHGNSEMNSHLAKMVVPLIGHMLKEAEPGRKFNICDMGAGNGDTTIAILTEMADSHQAREFEARCSFHLIEPSYKKVGGSDKDDPGIGQRLDEHPLQPETTLVVSTLERYTPALADGHFDMFISNAVLHHMNTPNHLKGLHRKLSENGLLVTGDWYTTIWSRPAFLVAILRDLGMDETKIRRFENYFGIMQGDAAMFESRLTPEQIVANRYMRDYIHHLQEELGHVGPKSKVKLFEAHQSFEERQEDLRKTGFITDPGEMGSKYRYFVNQANVRRYYPTTDILCASVAGKRTTA